MPGQPTDKLDHYELHMPRKTPCEKSQKKGFFHIPDLSGGMKTADSMVNMIKIPYVLRSQRQQKSAKRVSTRPRLLLL